MITEPSALRTNLCFPGKDTRSRERTRGCHGRVLEVLRQELGLASGHSYFHIQKLIITHLASGSRWLLEGKALVEATRRDTFLALEEPASLSSPP